MKKATIAALGGCVVFLGMGTGYFMFMPKEHISLVLDGYKASWVSSRVRDMIEHTYYVYNDDFLVGKLDEKTYNITKGKLIDEIGPDKIRDIDITYTKDNIAIKWDSVLDMGTDNNIWVGLYNEKDRLISYSNKEKLNFASGISKYIFELDGEKYEVYNNSVNIDREKIKNGITNAQVYAIDNRGNIGSIASIPLYKFDIILSKEEQRLRFHVDDSSQLYRYKLFIDEKEHDYISTNDELNELLIDKKSPDKISRVDIDIDDKKASIVWKAVVDRGSSYDVRLDGYGLTHMNTVYSDTINFTKSSGIKGYYYKINKTANYKVTDKDDFTEGTSVDFTDNYGKYYLHLAPIDNAGNVASTVSKLIEFKDPSLEVEKPDGGNDGGGMTEGETEGNNGNQEEVKDEKTIKIEKMLMCDAGVSSTNNKKAKYHLNKLSEKTIDMLFNQGVKIRVTSGRAETVHEELTGESISNITGSFIWGPKGLYVISEASYLDSSLLHEVGHAVDYLAGSGSFVSETPAFGEIYELEKELLFSDNSYAKSSEKEYFAEAYLIYYTSPYSLKSKAPQTYSFIKSHT